MKFSLFISFFLSIIPFSNLFSQTLQFDTITSLDSAIKLNRLEMKSFIQNKQFDSLETVANYTFDYLSYPDKNGKRTTLFSTFSTTKRERIIIQFLTKDYRNLLSGIAFGKSYFDLKGGELMNDNFHKIEGLDSLNLTLNILPSLRQINVDSLIEASDLNFLIEDVELLKLYWQGILIYMDSKLELPHEFYQLAEIYKSKFPNKNNGDSFITQMFTLNEKMHILSSINFEANYSSTFYNHQAKKNFNIGNGGNILISYKQKLIDVGIGYQFNYLTSRDSIYRNEMFILDPQENALQNTLYFYQGYHFVKWKRLEFGGNWKFGSSRIYQDKNKLFSQPFTSVGLDLKLNLSRKYKVDLSKLKYQSEDYSHNYYPLYLTFASAVSNNTLESGINPKGMLYNFNVGIQWKLGRLRPIYQTNEEGLQLEDLINKF